jgi:hypothetical protein
LLTEEHLGLLGHLLPGESVTIDANPALYPWLNARTSIFSGLGDYARIVWEEQTIDYRGCDGSVFHPESVSLHADGEGSIQLDVIVPFNDRAAVQMSRGWNLVPINGGTLSLEDAFGDNLDAVEAIYTYDAVLDGWLRFVPGLPDQAVTITALEDGRVYWVLAKRPFTLVVPVN